MAKTKPANIEKGSDHEEEEATPIAPPPARKKKATVAGAHISQKRPANKKGQAKGKMAASESVPAVVYYPSELGYAANGEDDATSESEGSEISEEEEEWRPAGQKVSN